MMCLRAHLPQPLSLCLLLTILIPNRSLAEVDAQPRPVHVSVSGTEGLSPEVLVQLLTLLRGSLSSLPIAPTLMPGDRFDIGVLQDESPSDVVQVWIHLAEEPGIVLYFLDRRASRLLIRRIRAGAVPDNVQLEETAHALQLSLEAILSGQELGQPVHEAIRELRAASAGIGADQASNGSLEEGDERAEEDAEGSESARAMTGQHQPVRRARPFALGLAYEANVVADTPALRHGLAGRFDFYLGPWALSASVGVRFPDEVAAEGTGASFAAVPMTIGGAWVSPAWLRTRLRMGLSVGTDLTHLRPKVTESSLAPEPATWLLIPELGGHLSLQFAITSRIRLNGGLSLLYDPSHSHYVIQRPDGPQTVLDPSPLRLVVQAGVEVALGGGA